MKAYVVSPGAEGASTGGAYVPFIKQHQIAVMGWAADDSDGEKRIGHKFADMPEGSLVIIASGMNSSKTCVGAGFAGKSDPALARKIGIAQVRHLVSYVSLEDEKLPFSAKTSKYRGQMGNRIPACYDLDPERYAGDKAVIRKVLTILEKSQGGRMIDEMIKLLDKAKQIVFTGAPGTGKTYLARQIAQKIILGKVVTKEEDLTPDEIVKLKDQMEFVQFHPSYDYTDFIEGLRPYTVDDDATPGFKREDGVFKRLCKRALRDDVDGGEDNFEEAWGKLVALIDDAEEERIEIPCLKKAKTFPVEMNSYRDGLASRMYDESQKNGYVHGRSKFMNKEQLYRIYRGLPGTPKKGHDNYRKAIVEFMRNECGLKPYKKGKERSAEDRRKYVMIVDEINRGDIAKIFGELFFAMDKGYRGKKAMALKTQYQNLVDDDDDFGEGFYVPDNVYIIGTMNDIDRNVESMDFAIRRRFTWKEISPDMRFDAMWSDLEGITETVKTEARRRMNAINKVISTTNGLGPAYQIGPSYFRELDTYKEEADDGFGSLWNNHLEPLVREYLRGFPNAEKLIEKIRTEYNKPEVTDEEVTAE